MKAEHHGNQPSTFGYRSQTGHPIRRDRSPLRQARPAACRTLRLDAATRIMCPDAEPELIRPRKPSRRGCDWFGRRTCSASSLTYCTNPEQPLSPPQLAQAIMVHKGMDVWRRQRPAARGGHGQGRAAPPGGADCGEGRGRLAGFGSVLVRNLGRPDGSRAPWDRESGEGEPQPAPFSSLASDDQSAQFDPDLARQPPGEVRIRTIGGR